MAEAKASAKYEPPKELPQAAAVQKFQGRAKRQPVDQAEYFYSVKTMHIVMFASSLALVLGYFLMFRKDYDRPWKDYQQQYADMDFEKLWYELNEHRKAGENDKSRIGVLQDQAKAFLEAVDGKELKIGVLDPEAAGRSPNLAKPEWALVKVVADKDKQKLDLAQRELIRGKLYDAQQLFNFAKDEAAALRFQYESSKHHFEDAEKHSDPRKDVFEKHYREKEHKYFAKLKEVDDRKKIADDYYYQNAFYEDLASDLQKRPVPGIWDFIERLSKAETEAFAALAKNAKLGEASRAVFARFGKAYEAPAGADRLKAMADKDVYKPAERALLAALAAGKAPSMPDELRLLHRLATMPDQRLDRPDRDALANLGRPLLSRAEREAVAADLAKVDAQGRSLVDRLLRMPIEDVRKEIGEIRKQIADRETRFEKERPNLANQVRNKPGLDFISPTHKVRQVVLGGIKDQLNFAQVDKVDRCQTCHVGIENPVYEVWVNPAAPNELEKYTFKDPILRKFVAHATGKTEGACGICDTEGRASDTFKKQMPAPKTAHGAWSSGDAIRFTKTFMAHPRLDLYVGDGSKHPMLKFGCTVCHEGDGRDTDFSRVVHMPDSDAEGLDWKARHGTPYGEEHYNWNYRELWDLPMIQTKFLQASCRRCHKEAVELDGADKYVRGMKLFERVGCYGCHRTETYQILPKDTSNPNLAANFKTRRPGPPLKNIAAKVDEGWAVKWVLEPRAFRPTTRMPHFFGQSNTRTKVNGHEVPIEKDKNGVLRSPVDDAIATSIVKYLWSLSDNQPAPEPPASVKGDAGRGALLVAQVGCLACHKTADTPKADYGQWKNRSRYLEDFGPALAAIGSKIKSRGWLYGWVRNPKTHFPDSSMPSLRLSEQEAVDVVEYLMTLKNPEFEKGLVPTADAKVVENLVFEQLRKKMPDVDARRELAGKGDIAGLDKEDVRLRWLGQKMVKNFGCYSCHELKKDGELDWTNEEGIGVELTGAQPWGVKHWDRLDFGFAANDNVAHQGVTFPHAVTGVPITAKVNETRQDWLWQKLQNPRVYDGGKMGSKPWDELLRMPNFDLTDYEIELLQTFVLSFTDHEVAGLVAGTKKHQGPDEKAAARGERIARDNNCAACHRFSLDRFEVQKTAASVEWVEGRTEPRTPAEAAGILKEWELIKDAKEADRFVTLRILGWGYHHRTLTAPKSVGQAEYVVHDGRDWWLLDTTAAGKKEKLLVRRYLPQDGGTVLPVIEQVKRALEVDYQARRKAIEKALEDQIKNETDKAKKKILEDGFDENLEAALKKAGVDATNLIPNDPGQYEVRYPPMLRTQGVKTQADWLFGFLKNPRPIRPNLFPLTEKAKAMPDTNIRMPSFDLADEEAAALVKWFAVRDHQQGVDVYPHTPIPPLEEARVPFVKKLFKDVVTDKDKGCLSCHWMRGQAPSGDAYKHAPDLAEVAQRLRPRWLETWVENPVNIAPRMIMLPGGDVIPGHKEATPEKKKDNIKGLVEALMNMKRLSAEPSK